MNDITLRTTIGQYIRRLRVAQGWSLRQLEEYSGVSRNRLSRQEHGTVLLREEDLITLIQHLNGDLDMLTALLYPDSTPPPSDVGGERSEYVYSLHIPGVGWRGIRAASMRILPDGGLELRDGYNDVITTCSPGQWQHCWREDVIEERQPLSNETDRTSSPLRQQRRDWATQATANHDASDPKERFSQDVQRRTRKGGHR